MEKREIYNTLSLIFLFYSIVSIFLLIPESVISTNSSEAEFRLTNSSFRDIAIVTRIEPVVVPTNSTTATNQTLKVRESEEDYENEGGGGSGPAGEESNISPGESSNVVEQEQETEAPELETQPQQQQILPQQILPQYQLPQQQLLPQYQLPQQQLQQQQLLNRPLRPLELPSTTTEESSFALFSNKLVPAVNDYLSTLTAVQNIQGWGETIKDRILNPKLPDLSLGLGNWKNLDLLGSLQSESQASGSDPAASSASAGALAPFNSNYLLLPLKQAQLLGPIRPDRLLAPFNKKPGTASDRISTEAPIDPQEAEASTPEPMYNTRLIQRQNVSDAVVPGPDHPNTIFTNKPLPAFPPLKPAHSEAVPSLTPAHLSPAAPEPPASGPIPQSILSPLFIPSQLLQNLNAHGTQLLEQLHPDQLLAPFKPAPAPATQPPPPTLPTRRPLIYSKTTAKPPKPENEDGGSAYQSLIDIFGPFTLPPRPSGIEIVTLGSHPIRKFRPVVDDELEAESITLEPESIPGFLNRYQDSFGSGAGTKARERLSSTTKKPPSRPSPLQSIANLLFFLD